MAKWSPIVMIHLNIRGDTMTCKATEPDKYSVGQSQVGTILAISLQAGLPRAAGAYAQAI